jgi:hypothetical protein
MTEPRFKGIAMVSLRTWFDERLGAGWFLSTAREHDPEWPERLLPGDWYSVRTGLHVYTQAFEQLDGYESREHLMETVAGATAITDLNGMMRAYLWAATPRMFLRAAPKIWGTYANFAVAEVLSNETGRMQVRVSEVPVHVLGWVMAAWKGFLVPALKLAGGKDPTVGCSEIKQTVDAETWEFLFELTYS